MSQLISRPTLPSPTTPPAALPPALSIGQPILPVQLWASLTTDQQLTVVRTIVAVGRQLVQNDRPSTPQTEVPHD